MNRASIMLVLGSMNLDIKKLQQHNNCVEHTCCGITLSLRRSIPCVAGILLDTLVVFPSPWVLAFAQLDFAVLDQRNWEWPWVFLTRKQNLAFDIQCSKNSCRSKERAVCKEVHFQQTTTAFPSLQITF